MKGIFHFKKDPASTREVCYWWAYKSSRREREEKGKETIEGAPEGHAGHGYAEATNKGFRISSGKIVATGGTQFIVKLMGI